MLNTLHAERVTIDETEDGFLLTIVTEEIGTVRVNIQDVAVTLEAEVRRELRPYVLEADHVLAHALPVQYLGEDDDETGLGYAPTDPKNPAFVRAIEAHADQLRDAAIRLSGGS